MNTEKDIIANILQIRMKKRLTQKDLSIALGVSEATYNRIESGKITLSYNHIAKIARAFSMSIIDIITYPEIYSPAVKIPSSKRIIVELDLSEEEFINTGLRDKVIQNLNNRR
jgi:DNA-binding helix-turn-helix protein